MYAGTETRQWCGIGPLRYLLLMPIERWEYQSLYITRWRDVDGWKTKCQLLTGTDATELWVGKSDDATQPNTRKILNEWGSQGWELVGPPWTENMVSQEIDIDNNLQWIKAGRWVTLSYWMKRRLQPDEDGA